MHEKRQTTHPMRLARLERTLVRMRNEQTLTMFEDAEKEAKRRKRIAFEIKQLEDRIVKGGRK